MLRKSKQNKAAGTASTEGVSDEQFLQLAKKVFGQEKKSAFDIGKDGTVEEFIAANKEAAHRKDKDRSFLSYPGADDQRALRKGAIAGFLEGNPENLQTILADPYEFKINSYSSEYVNCEFILSQLIKASDHQAAIIALAIAKIPEEKKQRYLDNLLFHAVSDKYCGEDLVDALLKAGANADADSSGFKGVALASAVQNGRPLAVVKNLHDNGADFKDALFYMKAKKFEPKEIKALKDYREEITGERATIEVNPEVMQQLLDQVAELTKRLPPQVAETVPRKDETAEQKVERLRAANKKVLENIRKTNAIGP